MITKLSGKIESSKWAIIAAILFFVFLLLTPLPLYDKLGVWLVLVQSLLCGFLVLMTTFGLTHFGDVFHMDDEIDGSRDNSLLFIPFLTFFVTLAVLLLYFESGREDEIRKKGVLTKSVILDGSMTTIKSLRGTTHEYNLTFEFTSEEGVKYVNNTLVNEDIFTRVSKGLEVEVIYLPDHPEIFELLLMDENIRKFTNVPNRHLEFPDLEKLMSLSIDGVLPYLLSISKAWNPSESEESQIFENPFKREEIAIRKSGEITFKGDLLTWIKKPIPKERIISESKSDSISLDGYRSASVKIYELKEMRIKKIIALTKEGVLDVFYIFTKK